MESLAELRVDETNTTTPLGQVARGTVWYGLAVAVNRFSPGILTVILTWWLEPSKLGVISFVLSYYGVLSVVADWSIAYAVQKLILEKSDEIREVAWTALLVRLSLSMVLGAACWGLDAAAGVFHGYGAYLALLIIGSAFGTIVYIHNALCNFAKASLYSILFQVVWVPLALILVRIGLPITGPLLALCISFAVVGIPGFLLSPVLRGRITFLPSVAAEILRFGAWATLATLLSGFTDQVGVLVVAYRNGDAAAGVFKVAATFGVVPALLGMVVAMPLMPVAKQGLLRGDNVSGNLVRPLVRYLVMLGLPIVATAFALAPAVIRTFVREAYIGAVWPMRILLLANLLRMVVTALSGILFVGQGLKELARVHGTVAAVAFIGSVLAARDFGSTGVATSLLISWVIGVALLYRWFERRAPLRLEWGKYFRYGGSAALIALFVYFAVRPLHSPAQQFLLGGGVAGIAFALLMWFQGDLAFRSLVRNLWGAAAK